MIQATLQKQLKAASGPMEVDVSFTTQKGEFIALSGPSGSGKTSLLRMLAGLMTPDSGKIIKDSEKIWYDSTRKIDMPPQRRNVGIVFQDYALFPNMTVYQNLKYAANSEGLTMIDELISITDLGKLRDRHPQHLSGGQRQRVALARALVQRPDLLLLDEPLSALDQDMRSQLQSLVLELHRKFGQTTIMVSHDVGEIVRLADRVVLLKHGKISDQGAPADIFTSHAVSGKFQLTGEVLRIIPADVVHVAEILCGNHLIKVVIANYEEAGIQVGDRVVVASKAFNPVIKRID